MRGRRPRLKRRRREKPFAPSARRLRHREADPRDRALEHFRVACSASDSPDCERAEGDRLKNDAQGATEGWVTGTQPEHARTSALERRFSGSSSRKAEPKYYTQLDTALAAIAFDDQHREC